MTLPLPLRMGKDRPYRGGRYARTGNLEGSEPPRSGEVSLRGVDRSLRTCGSREDEPPRRPLPSAGAALGEAQRPSILIGFADADLMRPVNEFRWRAGRNPGGSAPAAAVSTQRLQTLDLAVDAHDVRVPLARQFGTRQSRDRSRPFRRGSCLGRNRLRSGRGSRFTVSQMSASDAVKVAHQPVRRGRACSRPRRDRAPHRSDA